jgi:hypothetical protein
MPTNVTWKLNLEVQSGPKVVEAKTVQVDAFDRIEVSVPDTTASPAETEIDIQPGATGKIKVLLIRSNRYGDDLKYKVHDTTGDERALNEALFLAGNGSLDLIEDASAPLDKLLVTNTTGAAAVIEIIVGRSAV